MFARCCSPNSLIASRKQVDPRTDCLRSCLFSAFTFFALYFYVVDKRKNLEKRLQNHHEKQRAELQQRRARYEAKQKVISHRLEKKKKQVLREKHRASEQTERKNEASRRHKNEEMSRMWAAKQACLSRLTEQHKLQERRANQEAKKREELRRKREQRRQTIVMRNKSAEKEKEEILRDRWTNREKTVAKLASERHEKNRLRKLLKSVHSQQKRERVLRRKEEQIRTNKRGMMVCKKCVTHAYCERATQHICVLAGKNHQQAIKGAVLGRHETGRHRTLEAIQIWAMVG